MSFLPVEMVPNLFVWFGVLILCGLLGAIVAKKLRYIPRISAFMAVGWMFGPEVLGLLTHDTVLEAKVFVDIALGIIMLNVGRAFVWREVASTPGVVRAGAMQIVLTFGLVALGFDLTGHGWVKSVMLGAMGVSSSPAIALMVVREFGAHGPVSRHSLYMLAMNNLAAFVIFTALLPLIYWQFGGVSWQEMVVHPLYLLAGSFMVAYVVYTLGNLLAQREDPEGRKLLSFLLLIGLLAMSIGLSKMLALPSILTCLFLGMMIGNLRHTKLLRERAFGEQEEAFVMILFVLAGAEITLHSVVTYWPWVLLFIGLRTAGAFLGVWAAGDKSGLGWKQTAGVTGMLLPMAGLAMGLGQLSESLFPALGRELMMMVLACVAVLETVGPIVSELALKVNGEIDGDMKLEH